MSTAPGSGFMVGSYRLLEEIGRGGRRPPAADSRPPEDARWLRFWDRVRALRARLPR